MPPPASPTPPRPTPMKSPPPLPPPKSPPLDTQLIVKPLVSLPPPRHLRLPVGRPLGVLRRHPSRLLDQEAVPPPQGSPELETPTVKEKSIVDEIYALKAQQREAREKKKQVSKELRNAEKRRQRLKKEQSN